MRVCVLVCVCMCVCIQGYLNKRNLEEMWEEMRVMREDAVGRDKVRINEKWHELRQRREVKEKEKRGEGKDEPTCTLITTIDEYISVVLYFFGCSLFKINHQI